MQKKILVKTQAWITMSDAIKPGNNSLVSGKTASRASGSAFQRWTCLQVEAYCDSTAWTETGTLKQRPPDVSS